MARITIFGKAGTGTTSVGKVLANSSGYIFLSSGDIFRHKAGELGLELNNFEKLCLRNFNYDIKLDSYVAEFGKKNGDCVVESRLAYHFIPGSIKVKLICDHITRIKRVAVRDGIAFSAASEKQILEKMLPRKDTASSTTLKTLGLTKNST